MPITAAINRAIKASKQMKKKEKINWLQQAAKNFRQCEFIST